MEEFQDGMVLSISRELANICNDVSEFGTDTKITKENVVLVIPSHQKVSACVGIVGFVMDA